MDDQVEDMLKLQDSQIPSWNPHYQDFIDSMILSRKIPELTQNTIDIFNHRLAPVISSKEAWLQGRILALSSLKLLL